MRSHPSNNSVIRPEILGSTLTWSLVFAWSHRGAGGTYRKSLWLHVFSSSGSIQPLCHQLWWWDGENLGCRDKSSCDRTCAPSGTTHGSLVSQTVVMHLCQGFFCFKYSFASSFGQVNFDNCVYKLNKKLCVVRNIFERQYLQTKSQQATLLPAFANCFTVI